MALTKSPRKQAPIKLKDARAEKDPASIGWSKWHLFADKNSKNDSPLFRIRRFKRVDGKIKYQSLDFDDFSMFSERPQLVKLVEQLNVRYVSDRDKAKKVYDFKHLFITQEVKDAFRDELLGRVSNKRNGRAQYSLLRRYSLHWFINVLKKPDPIDWKRNQTLWGQMLLCELKGKQADKYGLLEEKFYPDTISKIIQITNNFLVYLHDQYPEVVPPIKLTPISKSVMNEYRSNFEPGDEYVPGKYIDDNDWEKIKTKMAGSDIEACVLLQYHLGVRRSEALGLTRDSVREECVKITHQLYSYKDKTPKYGKPKTRAGKRDIEYWFTTKEEVYGLVDRIQLMHPDTYAHKFSDLMKELKMDYSSHDCRRTFVSRAFRLNPRKEPIDIMRNCGHRNLKTTLRYAVDDRKLERDRRFIPKPKISAA